MQDDDREYVAGLHTLGLFLSQNQEVLDRVYPLQFWIPVYDSEDNPARTQMQSWARMLAPCEKNYDTSDFELKKRFGPHTITVYTSRENVCTKRVVGTKQVERRTYTAEQQRVRDEMEAVTILEDEEVVEWDCPPSLLGD